MHCNSNTVKLNGHYGNGVQRWYCKDCNRSFRWSNTRNKQHREQHWFEQWIREGYAIRQIATHTPHSTGKLRLIIGYWLSRTPDIIRDYTGCKYLMCDGTFIHRPIGVLAAMDGYEHTVIDGQYGINEQSRAHLYAFFSALQQRGLCPKSCTVDGNMNMIRSLLDMWPNIIIQRCVVHIQRQGLMWCRRSPKRADAKHLRNIFLLVTVIDNKAQRDAFVERIRQWEQVFGRHIDQSQERGRVFSDIKRARSMLLKALPNMFHYLDDPLIPRSTNGLEGYFSRLKHDYRNHRGLSPHKRYNYFKWYFYLKPK